MVYDLRYVGASSLPSRLPDFDLRQYFQLTQTDIATINAEFRGDRRAGAAVLLLFLRASGRPLDQVATIPRSLLRYVGEALVLSTPTIASLRAIYKRAQTFYAHQRWAKEYLGIKDVDQAASDELFTYLAAQANEVVSVDELVTSGFRWLFERKILIPGDRPVRDLARKCYESVEMSIFETITAAVDGLKVESCRNLVYGQMPDGSGTVLEWLKTPPKRHGPTTFKETLEKITFLKDLGVHNWALNQIPLEKQRGYAQRIQSRRPAMSKRVKDTTATIELVFFLRVTLLELSDSAIYQSGRRVSDLVRTAYGKTQAKQARSSVTYRERLMAIKALVKDTSLPAEDLRAIIGELLEDIEDKPLSSHAAHVRVTLTDEEKRVRGLLHSMENLSLEGRDNEKSLKNLAKLREFYAGKVTELPGDQTFETEKGWQELVNDPDRTRAFKALEAATMMGLSKALRRGSAWVAHSMSYRERDQMLIPPHIWEIERDRHAAVLEFSTDPNKFLEPLLGNIDAGIAAFAEAQEKGIITIDPDGTIRLHKLEALPDDPLPKRTNDLLYKEIGDVQFPDLIMEVDAHTNFSEILLGRRASSEQELVALYAALIAHGTEIDAKSVAAMTPQLDPAHVSSAMRALETPGRVRRANERVVEFQMKHAIADIWGGGRIASSDSMSIDVSKHLWNARTDPRRRTHAVGLYTHILDKYGVIYDQPIVLNERQAGPAIAGVEYYNNSEERIRLSLLAVDTHGYTNVALAVAKGLHFDLCPRLRSLTERKLYLPRHSSVPDGLDQVVIKEVSLTAIRNGWDEYLRLVASIRSGRISANVAMQRFGSAAQGDPLHKAAEHLGRLLRTLFLCDYFSNIEFRREILTILNRGESVHFLQRAIYYGRVPTERGRRPDEMTAISGSHTLLTNLVIAWNTHKMQETVDRWRKSGRPIDDAWLHRMGPGHFAHINFRGTFKFGVDRYADILLQRPQKSRPRQQG